MNNKLTKFISVLFLLIISQVSLAESMTKSCSGTTRYCDQYGICSDEYFYLYAYQYVNFRNGTLDRERHRFNFRGYILGEEDGYTFSGVTTNRHLIYTGPDFDLAIPWNEFVPIYMVHRDTGIWEVLCR